MSDASAWLRRCADGCARQSPADTGEPAPAGLCVSDDSGRMRAGLAVLPGWPKLSSRGLWTRRCISGGPPDRPPSSPALTSSAILVPIGDNTWTGTHVRGIPGRSPRVTRCGEPDHSVGGRRRRYRRAGPRTRCASARGAPGSCPRCRSDRHRAPPRSCRSWSAAGSSCAAPCPPEGAPHSRAGSRLPPWRIPAPWRHGPHPARRPTGSARAGVRRRRRRVGHPGAHPGSAAVRCHPAAGGRRPGPSGTQRSDDATAGTRPGRRGAPAGAAGRGRRPPAARAAAGSTTRPHPRGHRRARR